MTEQQDIRDPWEDLKQEPNPAKTDPAEVLRWRELRRRMIDFAKQYGWSKAEASKRSDIAPGTFYAWMDGSYNANFANTNDRIERFFQAIEDLNQTASLAPTVPGFIQTPTAKKIVDALLFAQTMPEIAVIVMNAGMGKTFVLDHFRDLRPNVFKVTMRPSTRTTFKMMSDIAELFNLGEMDRAPTRIDKAVGTRVKRNGRSTLLLVDEAQHLNDEAVNQLRYFYDEYGVGLALVGNEELYARFGGDSPKAAYAQLVSRFGIRLKQMEPTAEDIDRLIDAWGITDDHIRSLCVAIARKPGALRQLTKTLQYAWMIAAGERRELSARDVKIAAQQRGLGA